MNVWLRVDVCALGEKSSPRLPFQSYAELFLKFLSFYSKYIDS